MNSQLTRRSALKQLALAGVSLPLLGRATTATAAETATSASAQPGLKLGVALVSLKGMPLEQAIAAVRRVGLTDISVNRAHLPWENSPPGWTSNLRKFQAGGVTTRCAGVLYVKNNEAQIRTAFEYVRTLGAPLCTCSPDPEALPLVEKFAKEYNIRVALHNHGPEDKVWPDPPTIWKAIESMDSRIGLCLDVGHSYRAGVDPVEAIHRYRSRLYDIHLKDSDADVGKEDVPIEMGRGRMDLRAILTTLKEVGYDQYVWFEYEKDPSDPLPGLAESVGYVRGLLRGMARV
jgi:sugar phosphate isomerase/epimerase